MAANAAPDRVTLHWWDGFNRDFAGPEPLPVREAEAQLRLKIKQGAIRGELRGADGERRLALARSATGSISQTYPPGPRG